MVYIHRVSPRSVQTEPEQTAMQCNETVRCQPDNDNTEHNFGHDCTKLFMDFFYRFNEVFLFTRLWNDDLLGNFGGKL